MNWLGLPQLAPHFTAALDDLSPLDKQILVERHLISREHAAKGIGSGVVMNRKQTLSIMINEEDHLRIQVLRAGFQLKRAWNAIDDFDSALEENLDYAFSPNLGYLTTCPTNLGTGLRASAMMHLPALIISNQMEKIVRAVNQLGMVVRGLFGDDRNGPIAQRQLHALADQVTVAFILGVHHHGDVAQHGFRAGGGEANMA